MARSSQSKGKNKAREDDNDALPTRRSRASQGRGRSGRRTHDEGEGEDIDEDGDISMDASQSEEKETEARAYDLVRLVLFAENNRTSLKRDEINKKVLTSQPRTFNAVFAAAQKILNKSFGLEMVELMSRIERDKATAPEDTSGGVNALSGKKKKVTSSSKTYILRSILPASLIEASLEHDPEIRNAAHENRDEDDEAEDTTLRPDDTLVAWRAGDDLAAIGILHVILALILVNGRSLPDPQLRAQLKKLHLRPGAQILHPGSSTHKLSTIETLLATFARSGYLDKQKSTLIGSTGGASSSQAPGGRGRKRTVDNDDGDGGVMEEFEWKWGSRAIAEINEAGVAAFVRDFMGARFEEREDEEAEGGGGAARRREAGAKSKGQEKVEKAVMNDLVRSAGGPLLEIQSRTHTVDDEQDGASEVGSEGG